jgi:stage V sporulation protein R
MALQKRIKMSKSLIERISDMEVLAKNFGLDFYPVNFEIVPTEVMLEVVSYGLPTRARHWSYGQSYDYQKMQGEMGHSKIYEVVLNNDPSYAFLLDTNTDIVNLMVAAHVFGHVHFFKNNYLFKQTDNKMVYHAAERAQRIEEYIAQYGLKEVERVMDIGFAIDKHIDWHKGIHRKPYPAKKTVIKEVSNGEFADMHGLPATSKKVHVFNDTFPPHPEYDLIWFLVNYSKDLESWKKDVLEIIREESYYFYPQYLTKIMNEGFASFCHADLMYETDLTSQSEHLEFCKVHERVVQPGSNKLNINPYFLGFSIFNDIKRRWDEKYKSGESSINGMQKVLQVVEEEDDISFVKGYLTKELVQELELFTYKHYKNNNDEIVEIVSTDVDDVAESLVKNLYDYRAPLVSIVGVEDGFLQLKHESTHIGTLDIKHMEKVCEYIYEIWKNPINIQTINNKKEEIHLTYDEAGFSG